jgi:hypothetical protein
MRREVIFVKNVVKLLNEVHIWRDTPECLFLCLFKTSLPLKAFSHISHLNNFSSECVRICCFIWQFVRKRLEQIVHLNGLLPEWTRMCSVNVFCVENAFLQILHSYGRSPVWILTCPCKWCTLLKDLEHKSYLYGFNPEWTNRWFWRLTFWIKLFSQMEHLNGRSPEWIFWCFFNTFFFQKNLHNKYYMWKFSTLFYCLTSNIKKNWKSAFRITLCIMKKQDTSTTQLNSSKMKELTCDVCDKISSSTYTFHKHMNTHTRLRTFQYIYISEIFATLYESGTHQSLQISSFLQWWDSPQFSEMSSEETRY